MPTITKLIVAVLLVYPMPFYVSANGDASYHTIKTLHENLLAPENYSTWLRPVLDQMEPIVIHFSFSLVAIVDVDDVKQELVTNGFIFLYWQDQVNTWNASDYGDFFRMAPEPKYVWRPRLLLINTVGDRYPFQDDYSHTMYTNDGQMGWVPGGIFRTYCALNMEKFPFDVQNCKIQLSPMSYTNISVQFLPDGDMNLAFYDPNPGWDLLETKVTAENISVVTGEAFSCPTFYFKLKRRSATVVLNVILPVIFMSVLNNFAFFIPGDSGEKISYAITVLLALTVFLSMVSTMTPQVSDVVPALTIYLFVLLLSSVLTVGAAIFSVHLHNLNKQSQDSNKDSMIHTAAVHKLLQCKTAATPIDPSNDPESKATEKEAIPPDEECERPSPRNKNYELIFKHIDCVFFCIMKTVWLIMTIWYFSHAYS